MRKILIALFIIFIASSFNFTYAKAAQSSSLVKIKCDINTSSITLNSKKMNVNTIKYNNSYFFTLKDANSYFKANIKIDSKLKSISILSLKGKNIAAPSSKNLIKKKNQNINVILNSYKVDYEGLNEHLENIIYRNEIYVPINYFSEMLNKAVTFKTGDKILIKDIKAAYVGTVDNDKLTQQDFDFFYNLSKSVLDSLSGEELVKAKEALKQSVFNKLVNNKILEKKAAKEKITITKTDLKEINETTMDSIISNSGGLSEFRKMLASDKITFHQYILNVKMNQIFNKLKMKLTSGITTSDEETKSYYDSNQLEFTVPEEVKVKQILISTVLLDDNGKATAKQKIDEILTRLKNGEDFDILMNQYSEDPGLATSPNGYTFARGVMVKEFEDAAFALNVGEISEVVNTVYGYHIIKLIERMPAKLLPYDSNKEYIKTMLTEKKKTNYFTDLLNQWKSSSIIVRLI